MLLSVNDLHVYYGAIHAVKGVSLEVNEGEIVTLIGANGAGKSTVLNTISGLLRAKTGTIEFMGTPINTMAPNKIVQLGLAQCPEGRRVFAHMTVEENLEMGAYTRPNSSIEGNLEHVYELFPRLKERSKQISGTLSGGEQQMLDVRAEASDAGRAVYGSGADPGRADLRYYPRAAQGRCNHPARRAERADGAAGSKPRLRSGNRQDHALRFWQGAS